MKTKLKRENKSNIQCVTLFYIEIYFELWHSLFVNYSKVKGDY